MHPGEGLRAGKPTAGGFNWARGIREGSPEERMPDESGQKTGSGDSSGAVNGFK